MRNALLLFLASAAPAVAQGIPQPLVCTLTEMTCSTACPAIGLVLPRGLGPVRIEGLPQGALGMSVTSSDEAVPPTFRLEGDGATGLLGLHADRSATLVISNDVGSIAYEGLCAPQP